ncbi:calponin homology domain-containing protein DDB_G0272472-like isoform X2 [Tripterygium wilfordii]|nr:calponin homology domain-containing protein DDB_G0272472-like isoform X2 [Tripterygium wilfordii]
MAESEVEERCSYQDLNKGGDCNGLEDKENGKDDCAHASYVFITGNDIIVNDPDEVMGLGGDSAIKNENIGSQYQGIEKGGDNAVSTDQGTAEELIASAAVTEPQFPPLGQDHVNEESSMEETSEPQRIVLLEVTECKGELPLLDLEKEKGGEVATLSVAESDQPLPSPGDEDEDSIGKNNSYLVAGNQESQIAVTEIGVQNEVDRMEEPAEITSGVSRKELELEVEQDLENPPADVKAETETTYIAIPDQDRVTLPSDHTGDSVTGSVLSNGSLAGNQDKAEENGPAEDVETLPSPHTGSASSEVPVADRQSDTGVDGNATVANENKDGLLSVMAKEIVSQATLDNEQHGFSDNADNLPSKIVSENFPVENSENLLSVTIDNAALNSAFDDARKEGEVENFDVKSNGYSVSNPAKDIGVKSEGVTDDHTKTIPLDNASANGSFDDARGKSDVVKSNECADSNVKKNAEVESAISVTLDNATMNCAVYNARTESGVEEVDVESNGSSDSNPKNHVEVELEVNNGHTIKETASSGRQISDVETAIETSLNSVESEEELCTISNGDANLLDNRSPENMDGESHAVALVKNQITSGDVKAESDMSTTDVLHNNSNVTLENERDQFTGIDRANKSKISTASLEGSPGDASEEQDVPAEPVKRPFYYLIKIPRFEDENLKAQIRQAQSQLDEKTQSRDAIHPEIQRKRGQYKEYADNLKAAISEEKTLQDLLRAKRKEMESLQAVSNRAWNAISVEGIEGTIRNMEHKLQHETLTLKEEKLLIREIKQLKQKREQVSSSMGTLQEVQEAIDQKEDIEERLKFLRKEADFLKGKIFKAKAVTRDARKKLNEESDMLNELQAQHQAADVIRQEAYTQLQSLKKQSFKRSKFFFNYRDDRREATDLASAGDKEALQRLCVNQVEKVMEQWNYNFEFRKDYTRCNMRSTLWRLRTLDGRSLGPDEDPPVIPNVLNERVASAVPPISTERVEKQVTPVDASKADDKSTTKVADQKNQTAKTKKPTKHAPSVSGSATVARIDEIKDVGEEEQKRTVEEEESARKAVQLRKEEQAAKLKEQRRSEEKIKAAEALERKKRIAEKAQARAALRAQREAEQKEKEKDKRARKKEKRKAAVGDDSNDKNEGESNPSSETITEIPRESEIEEKLVAVTKRPQKAPQLKLQSKAKSIPPPLRNRGKRRMQSWMWVLLGALVILALVLLGNSSMYFHYGLQRFGF